MAVMGDRCFSSIKGFLRELGDELTLFGVKIQLIVGGYMLKGKATLIDACASELGLDTARSSKLPGSRSDHEDEEVPFTLVEHGRYRRVAGRLNWLAVI